MTGHSFNVVRNATIR